MCFGVSLVLGISWFQGWSWRACKYQVFSFCHFWLLLLALWLTSDNVNGVISLLLMILLDTNAQFFIHSLITLRGAEEHRDPKGMMVYLVNLVQMWVLKESQTSLVAQNCCFLTTKHITNTVLHPCLFVLFLTTIWVSLSSLPFPPLNCLSVLYPTHYFCVSNQRFIDTCTSFLCNGSVLAGARFESRQLCVSCYGMFSKGCFLYLEGWLCIWWCEKHLRRDALLQAFLFLFKNRKRSYDPVINRNISLMLR